MTKSSLKVIPNTSTAFPFYSSCLHTYVSSYYLRTHSPPKPPSKASHNALFGQLRHPHPIDLTVSKRPIPHATQLSIRCSCMAPPWVTFDRIAAWNGDCANGAEPDIAGVGVRTPGYFVWYQFNNVAGRPVICHRKLHDYICLYPCYASRPSIRYEGPLHASSAAHIHPRALLGE